MTPTLWWILGIASAWLVAHAAGVLGPFSALTFPIDVFCRFTTEPGAGVGAADFAARIAEVTSGGKRADLGLLLVNVVVR